MCNYNHDEANRGGNSLHHRSDGWDGSDRWSGGRGDRRSPWAGRPRPRRRGGRGLRALGDETRSRVDGARRRWVARQLTYAFVNKLIGVLGEVLLEPPLQLFHATLSTEMPQHEGVALEPCGLT